mgnify:CR=1 FL=1
MSRIVGLAVGLVLAGVTAHEVQAAESGCPVAIDPGHTRKSMGATSARGRGEWLFNIELARVVERAMAAKGVSAVLINPEGGPIELRDRPGKAGELSARLLVSIHHDAVQPQYLDKWTWQDRTLSYSDRFSGFGLFVSAKNPAFEASQAVAHDMADELLAAGLRPSLHHAEPIAGENRPLLDSERGIYQYDDLVVLKYAAVPAVLVEAGVIVNRDEEVLAASPAYQGKIADALARAAARFCARQ